jgi:non-specific serine/threonine protein kinase
LPAPDARDTTEVNRSEAVRLFVERATARGASFRLTRDNAATIGRICRRLDGLPLAIELAAARANVLAPEQIEARLNDSLRLLATARRTATPRQRTLSATFDWSYALLSEDERRVFERLGVFPGPFPLEAAEAVCGAEPVGPLDVLDHLGELVDKSLVVAELDTDTVHYRLLQTVRTYAYQRLADRHEVETIQHQLAEWYARMMESAVGDLRADNPSQRTAGQRTWLAQLELEHDNVRAALAWSIQHGHTETALRLGAGMSRFWMYHGHPSEGRSWLTRVLALAGDDHPPHSDGTPFMDCMFSAGMLALQQGDVTATRRQFERILQLACLQRGRRMRGGAHIQLGGLALLQADLAEAQARFEEAIEILGDGNEWLVANACGGLARVALRRGDSTSARRLSEEALAVYRRVGDERQAASAAILLGMIQVDAGQMDAARARFREGMTVCREIHDPEGLIFGLLGSGTLAVAERRPEEALRLLGAADEHAGRNDLGLLRQSPAMKRAIQVARAKLTVRAANAALAAGRSLSLAQAVDEALGAAPCPDSQAVMLQTVTLTRREREVAVLIARGLTNRQIAEHLVISERTVDNHVANILEKLGFSVRAQVAAWTVEHGLAK